MDDREQARLMEALRFAAHYARQCDIAGIPHPDTNGLAAWNGRVPALRMRPHPDGRSRNNRHRLERTESPFGGFFSWF